MWNLNLETLWKHLPPGSTLPRYALETGTCRGAGTRFLARCFEQVITIELSEELHRAAGLRLKAEGFTNIEFIHGNSAFVLPKILQRLPADEPVFFFLDAHWSGDHSVDWSQANWKGYGLDTAHLGERGSRPTSLEQCPLLEELHAIIESCKGPALIVIDDLKNIPAQGLGLKDHEFPGEDWSHLSRELILSAVQPRLASLHESQGPSRWFLVLHSVSGAAQRSLSQ